MRHSNRWRGDIEWAADSKSVAPAGTIHPILPIVNSQPTAHALYTTKLQPLPVPDPWACKMTMSQTLRPIPSLFQDPVHEFMKRVSLGFTAGVFGLLANIPFDVAKSRIQGPQPVKGEIIIIL
ncbi:uncharacterized protein LOC120351645 [Nilaparvata lugens]|uniref:uncharacterized protein LOC120351645 n=1 Tax=Nilaparvata lugens TaxID=108931 RepID=UPI00193D673D|nr:uncharacterized protein LOC120351645 [Nilaparvata lugens]